jgi:hypothetical protein
MRQYSIADDADERTWSPEEKATERQMEVVLELLLEFGSMSQKELAEELSGALNMKIGTARAAVSASLLFFRQAGWVEVLEREGGSNIWRIIA